MTYNAVTISARLLPEGFDEVLVQQATGVLGVTRNELKSLAGIPNRAKWRPYVGMVAAENGLRLETVCGDRQVRFYMSRPRPTGAL